jgi:hypothetical protein
MKNYADMSDAEREELGTANAHGTLQYYDHVLLKWKWCEVEGRKFHPFKQYRVGETQS